MFNPTSDINKQHEGSGFVYKCLRKRKSLDRGLRFGSGALKGICDVVTGLI